MADSLIYAWKTGMTLKTPQLHQSSFSIEKFGMTICIIRLKPCLIKTK